MAWLPYHERFLEIVHYTCDVYGYCFGWNYITEKQMNWYGAC